MLLVIHHNTPLWQLLVIFMTLTNQVSKILYMYNLKMMKSVLGKIVMKLVIPPKLKIGGNLTALLTLCSRILTTKRIFFLQNLKCPPQSVKAYNTCHNYSIEIIIISNVSTDVRLNRQMLLLYFSAIFIAYFFLICQ